MCAKQNGRQALMAEVKKHFLAGSFPVVTTPGLDGARKIRKVLGLVAARGYDPEEVFYGMAAMAAGKGAQAVTGYKENVAFHPDGSRFYSCYGTAVRIEGEEFPLFMPPQEK